MRANNLRLLREQSGGALRLIVYQTEILPPFLRESAHRIYLREPPKLEISNRRRLVHPTRNDNTSLPLSLSLSPITDYTTTRDEIDTPRRYNFTLTDVCKIARARRTWRRGFAVESISVSGGIAGVKHNWY